MHGTKSVVAAATIFVVVALSSADAIAVTSRVRSACASDFLAYCSEHDADGAAARKCMRANGPKLSKACLDALIAAGEVSKREIARRERQK